MSEKTAEKPKKSRRGFKIYEQNPSVTKAYDSTKIGTRKVCNRTNKNNAFIISNEGEYLAPAQFYDFYQVDKSQFIKLYVQGIKALQGLSSSGTKVFELLYYKMQENIGKDLVCLHFNSIDQDKIAIQERTLHRGITELLKKEFIFESNLPSHYFININYMFNGDRLAFVKEYQVK
jgi:hypothetical protein